MAIGDFYTISVPNPPSLPQHAPCFPGKNKKKTFFFFPTQMYHSPCTDEIPPGAKRGWFHFPYFISKKNGRNEVLYGTLPCCSWTRSRD